MQEATPFQAIYLALLSAISRGFFCHITMQSIALYSWPRIPVATRWPLRVLRESQTQKAEREGETHSKHKSIYTLIPNLKSL